MARDFRNHPTLDNNDAHPPRPPTHSHLLHAQNPDINEARTLLPPPPDMHAQRPPSTSTTPAAPASGAPETCPAWTSTTRAGCALTPTPPSTSATRAGGGCAPNTPPALDINDARRWRVRAQHPALDVNDARRCRVCAQRPALDVNDARRGRVRAQHPALDISGDPPAARASSPRRFPRLRAQHPALDIVNARPPLAHVVSPACVPKNPYQHACTRPITTDACPQRARSLARAPRSPHRRHVRKKRPVHVGHGARTRSVPYRRIHAQRGRRASGGAARKGGAWGEGPGIGVLYGKGYGWRR
ncbi:hypothetical protein B0H11DRAFT_2261290 [Mycena galericulata]|nr:hypothetical protein B0H11DRAFT_2261290 [Mycena galericulata]